MLNTLHACPRCGNATRGCLAQHPQFLDAKWPLRFCVACAAAKGYKNPQEYPRRGK